MQSLYGKLRLVTKQTVNNLKNVELKKIASFESKFLGCSMNQFSGFNSQHCISGSAFFLNKNFGTKIVSPASSETYGIASVLPSRRGLSSGLNQSAPLVFSLPTRNITTAGSTSQNISASSDVPQRIKFKRLDKTARHIMQIIDKEAVEEVKANRELPEIKPGYIIQLKMEVPENKRRVSIIKGIVIARRNAGLNTTFRIRRLVAGVGIESLIPLYSPNIKEIKVLDKKKVRRAKLYYLRDKMNPLKK
ncbi:hypothetical protein Pfo_011082 [Paulownia fortunei]|nr:hypothetical protein Pfo_011082 [Paulownia fortunei]